MKEIWNAGWRAVAIPAFVTIVAFLTLAPYRVYCEDQKKIKSIHTPDEKRVRLEARTKLANLVAEGRAIIFEADNMYGNSVAMALASNNYISHHLAWRKKTIAYLKSLGQVYYSEFDMGDEVGQTHLTDEVNNLEKIEEEFR